MSWKRTALAVVLCAALNFACSRPGPHSFPSSAQKEMELSTAWVGPGNPRSPVGAVAVAWSPDGSKLVATSDYGATITVWNSSGKRLSQFRPLGNGPKLGPIAFTPDSTALLFTASPETDPKDAALIVWDALSGRRLGVFVGPDQGRKYDPDLAESFASSADGSFVAVGSGAGAGDRGINDVVTYDAHTGRVLRQYRVEGGIISLNVFAHNIVVGGTDSRVAVIDADSGAPPRELHAYAESPYGVVEVTSVAGSPDGSLILVGDGMAVTLGYADTSAPGPAQWLKSLDKVRALRPRDGAILATFNAPEGNIRDGEWDPKGRYVAILDNRDELFLWRPLSPDGGFLRVEVPHASLWLAISPDGDRIAVATDFGVNVYRLT